MKNVLNPGFLAAAKCMPKSKSPPGERHPATQAFVLYQHTGLSPKPYLSSFKKQLKYSKT